MYQSLLNFFENIIGGQVPVSLHQGMTFTKSGLSFTLPSLYQQLFAAAPFSYLEFRSQLYQSTLNADLATTGWTIGIVLAADNVDNTVYGLRRIVTTE